MNRKFLGVVVFMEALGDTEYILQLYFSLQFLSVYIIDRTLCDCNDACLLHLYSKVDRELFHFVSVQKGI